MVAVSGDSLPLDALHQVAEGLDRRDDGGFTVMDVPAGYVLAAESPGLRSDGTNAREQIYQDLNGRAVRIRVVDNTETPPGTSLQVGGPFDADPHLAEVRGRHAVVSRQLYNGSGGGYDQQTLFLQGSDVFVQWLEPQNVLVTVSSLGLSEDDTLAIARALRVVDQDGWDQVMVQAPGRSGTASTNGNGPPFQGTDADVANAFIGWLEATTVDGVVSNVESGEALRSTIEQVQMKRTAGTTGRVEAVRLVGDDRAFVTFSIFIGGGATLGNQQGAAVRVNGRWLVNRATYCAIVGMGGFQCPVT
jgi:hypothetical protein